MSSQVFSNSVIPFPVEVFSSPGDPAADGLRVVCFGGGTGLSNLLRGFKHHLCAADSRETETENAAVDQLTAVVAVTDDGGSSGRIRADFNLQPPGDIRNCLVALAEDEALLSRVFQYRFTNGNGLEGHSFGNLFITVLAELTDDFVEAVRLASTILGARGQILPAATVPAQLVGEMQDGAVVIGESAITSSRCGIRRIRLLPEDAPAVPETLAAIAHADLITVGPGSLFTSLVPNLLVPGIADAIAASPALKAMVCNLMTQPNETLEMGAADHLCALNAHAGRPLFDVIVLNQRPLPDTVLQSYAALGASPVACDLDQFAGLGVRIMQGNYLGEGSVARHDALAVSRDLIDVAREHRLRTIGALAA